MTDNTPGTVTEYRKCCEKNGKKSREKPKKFYGDNKEKNKKVSEEEKLKNEYARS